MPEIDMPTTYLPNGYYVTNYWPELYWQEIIIVYINLSAGILVTLSARCGIDLPGNSGIIAGY
jgi:hypothetical protein